MSPGQPVHFNVTRHTLPIASDKNPSVYFRIRKDGWITHTQSWCTGITDSQHIDLRVVPLQCAQKTRIKILVE
jgi:hypothetical protein